MDTNTGINDSEFEGVGTIDTDDEESLSSVYEIGNHLVPTISEEVLPSVVTDLTDLLKKENATLVGDRFPSKIQLAYSIAKRIAEKRTNYDSAYFGWVAFEVSRDAISRIKTSLDTNPNVLRYLIVTTDREAVAAALSGAVIAPTGIIEKPKRASEEGGELSEVDLDEALQDIVKEDAKVAE